MTVTRRVSEQARSRRLAIAAGLLLVGGAALAIVAAVVRTERWGRVVAACGVSALVLVALLLLPPLSLGLARVVARARR